MRASCRLTNPPGHLWRDKWTALSGPLSQEFQDFFAALPPGGVTAVVDAPNVAYAKQNFEGGQFSYHQVDLNGSTLHPKLEIRNLKPETRDPRPETMIPKPSTLNPKPQNPNPKPQNSTPKPETRDPKP